MCSTRYGKKNNKHPTNKSDSCIGVVVLTTRYARKIHEEIGRGNAKASEL